MKLMEGSGLRFCSKKVIRMLDFEDKRVKGLVKQLAQRIDLCRNFKDIVVVNDPKMPSMAGVNAKTGELFINLGNGIMSFEELSKCITGVVVHEAIHLDSRFSSPSDWKTFQQHRKSMKRRKLLNEKGMFWQNLVYDFEIHYQLNKRGQIKPKFQRELRGFLTMTRNKVFEKDPTDLVLSMEYPTTKEQKKVKKIIEDRNLDIIQKISKLAKDRKLNQPQEKGKTPSRTLITEMVENDSENDSKDKKGKSEQKKETKAKGVRIKKEIEKENQKNELVERLSNLGLSVEEINEVLQRKNVTDIVAKIECLENSMKDILPNLELEISKEKTNEKSKDIGHRINGYKRINDFSDLSRNVEDMVTVGEFDMEEVRIPYNIDRKCKGNILIVRDVSGSVSSPPMDKIVRDVTIAVIQIARKKQHKVGVVDFHSKVEPIYDKNKQILTTNYNILLLDSMKFKMGYSTLLSRAIEFINEEIVKKAPDVPLNVFIITDSMVDYDEEKMKIKGKTNVVGLWVTKISEEKYLDKTFEKIIKENNGKLFMISEENKEAMLTKLIRNFGG